MIFDSNYYENLTTMHANQAQYNGPGPAWNGQLAQAYATLALAAATLEAARAKINADEARAGRVTKMET